MSSLIRGASRNILHSFTQPNILNKSLTKTTQKRNINFGIPVTKQAKLFGDNEGFTQILPFNKENPLDSRVQSDHSEVAVRLNNQVMNVWNISNPAYHCYFKYGDKPPFHNTHMFVDQPFNNGVMEKYLAAKEANQIATIADRFVRGKVSVQIIVEGYESFFKDLSAKIHSLGHKEFQIISILNEKPHNWKSEWNVTGILVDTSRFKILHCDAFRSKYLEEQDSNKEKEFILPYVHVKDPNNSTSSYVIAGVHVNGCGSQYPKTGLETLKRTMKVLRDLKRFGTADIIAAGDYNTPPMSAKLSVASPVEPEWSLLKAPYPTHVNPKSEAANYDQVAILKGLGEAKKYEILTPENLSIASQKLISSIENSRMNFILGDKK